MHEHTHAHYRETKTEAEEERVSIYTYIYKKNLVALKSFEDPFHIQSSFYRRKKIRKFSRTHLSFLRL